MPANTDLADVNEIYTAFALNNNSFPDPQSEAQFNRKRDLLTFDQATQQIERAKVMAQEFLAWAGRNGYAGVQGVYWTARPGFSFRAVTGYDVNQSKNPTDVLVKFAGNKFLGLSAKSTSGAGDIGFKNPGIGTVETDLGIQLKTIATTAADAFATQYGLPSGNAQRKEAIRANPLIKTKADEASVAMFIQMRDVLFNKLNTLGQPQRRDYIIDSWIDASANLRPPYVKVTGMGTKAPFTASVEDPLNNEKLRALRSENITFEKVGDNSVGVKAGVKKILKMRIKYESEKFSSSLKMSGDPW